MKLYRKTWFWLLLITAGVVLFFVLRESFNSLEVKTVPVVRKDLEITVTATSTGTVKSDKEVKITAQRVGRISGLHVHEGYIVKKNSPVAELDPEEAHVNLQLHRASLDRIKASLDETKTSFKPLKTEVKAGVRKAGANLKETEDRLKRFRKLRQEGYISQMELDLAERDYGIAKANHASALSGWEQLRAKAQEITVREAAVREAESTLAMAELNYKYSLLNAPISGIITSVPVKPGETVMKGTLIAALIKTDSLYVEAFVDEADVGKVRIGQDVYISMDAYPDRTFHGKIYMISPVVLGGRLEARTFEVRARFNDKNTVLRPGMSADVEIVVDRVKDTLIVPSQAVMERDGKKFVYIKEGSRARFREIRTGLSDWTNTQVLSGIKEGDEVIITTDVPGLEDGKRVKV